MCTSKRLTEVFEAAREIIFDDSSKFVFFSDCHRGDNSWSDDFAKNQNIFFQALTYYYAEGFTYIELGDGDELFENTNFEDIRRAHSHIFELMRKFYEEKRLWLIWGNHDIERKDDEHVERTLHCFYDERRRKKEPLFKGIEVYEGLVLRHGVTGKKMFLVHGHQGDFMNEYLWRLSRFFVRYFWRWFQTFGVKDPTRPSKNLKKLGKVEKRLSEWAWANDQMLIAGHTHRSMFPRVGKPPYFNTGSCVHPRSITGIEIQRGNIGLIKWWIKPKKDGALYVTREILAGPEKLESFWGGPDLIAAQKLWGIDYLS